MSIHEDSRLAGFYWVKTATIPGIQVGEWQPAFFTGEWWELCGNDRPKPDEYFTEIGERIMASYQPIRGNTEDIDRGLSFKEAGV